MTAKIDLAVMQVLQKLLSTAEMGQLPSAPGIYFSLMNPAGFCISEPRRALYQKE